MPLFENVPKNKTLPIYNLNNIFKIDFFKWQQVLSQRGGMTGQSS
jgi:hypothetical protein